MSATIKCIVMIKEARIVFVDNMHQLGVVVGESVNSLELIALTTIEHLRQLGITTSVGVARVLGRASEIVTLSRSTSPTKPAIRATGSGSDSMSDCPKCRSPSLNFHSNTSKTRPNGAGVTRITLVCVAPGCGFLDS